MRRERTNEEDSDQNLNAYSYLSGFMVFSLTSWHKEYNIKMLQNNNESITILLNRAGGLGAKVLAPLLLFILSNHFEP